MVVAKYKNPNAQVPEGIALAHTIHGESENARLNPERVGASEGTIQQVAQPHMSHYKPPARRNPENAAKPLSRAKCPAGISTDGLVGKDSWRRSGR